MVSGRFVSILPTHWLCLFGKVFSFFFLLFIKKNPTFKALIFCTFFLFFILLKIVIFLFTIYSDYISSSLNPPGQLLSPNEASSAKKWVISNPFVGQSGPVGNSLTTQALPKLLGRSFNCSKPLTAKCRWARLLTYVKFDIDAQFGGMWLRRRYERLEMWGALEWHWAQKNSGW